jgi:hypothetical protein
MKFQKGVLRKELMKDSNIHKSLSNAHHQIKISTINSGYDRGRSFNNFNLNGKPPCLIYVGSNTRYQNSITTKKEALNSLQNKESTLYHLNVHIRNLLNCLTETNMYLIPNLSLHSTQMG